MTNPFKNSPNVLRTSVCEKSFILSSPVDIFVYIVLYFVLYFVFYIVLYTVIYIVLYVSNCL